MKETLIAIVASAAGVSWLVAMISSIAMLKHRAPGVSIMYLMVHGMAFFRGDSFTEGAARHRKRFLRAFAGFFLCIVFLMLITMIFRP
jgi:hypothetical protein